MLAKSVGFERILVLTRIGQVSKNTKSWPRVVVFQRKLMLAKSGQVTNNILCLSKSGCNPNNTQFQPRMTTIQIIHNFSQE